MQNFKMTKKVLSLGLFMLFTGISFGQSWNGWKDEKLVIDNNSYCSSCPWGSYNRTLAFGWDADGGEKNVKFVARTKANNYNGNYTSNISKDLRLYVNGKTNMHWNSVRVLSHVPLYVNNEIRAKSLLLENQTWADYVFEKDYYLMPLNKVKSFIKENKHLPGVPSAKEVEKNGIRVEKVNEVLLKKIEELTLYVLEQQEKIEELNNKVLNLKK